MQNFRSILKHPNDSNPNVYTRIFNLRNWVWYKELSMYRAIVGEEVLPAKYQAACLKIHQGSFQTTAISWKHYLHWPCCGLSRLSSLQGQGTHIATSCSWTRLRPNILQEHTGTERDCCWLKGARTLHDVDAVHASVIT